MLAKKTTCAVFWFRYLRNKISSCAQSVRSAEYAFRAEIDADFAALAEIVVYYDCGAFFTHFRFPSKNYEPKHTRGLKPAACLSSVS